MPFMMFHGPPHVTIPCRVRLRIRQRKSRARPRRVHREDDGGSTEGCGCAAASEITEGEKDRRAANAGTLREPAEPSPPLSAATRRW